MLRSECIWRFGGTAVEPPFKVIIVRRLLALATDSGTSSSISRESITVLRISVVSPVPSPPRPLSDDRDASSKDREFSGAADDVHQNDTALSGAAEEAVDIATIPSWVIAGKVGVSWGVIWDGRTNPCSTEIRQGWHRASHDNILG